MDNNILCGGTTTTDSCLKWSTDTGTWEEYLTLDVERYDHVSWTPATGIGIYLMGGTASERTTTLIGVSGTQEPGFDLQYDTRYNLRISHIPVYFNSYVPVWISDGHAPSLSQILTQ